jgi:O-antigen/teichoic acid export membrane protein
MVLLILPAGAGLIFLSQWIMGLYGIAFREGDLVFACVAASALIQCTGIAAGSALQAMGRMWIGLAQNLSWGILFVLLVWILSPGLRELAFGLGLAISYIVLTIWGFAYLAKDLPPGMMTRVFRTLFFIVVLTVSYALLPQKTGLLAIPVAGIAAAVSLLFFVDEAVRARVLRTLRNPRKGSI